MAERKTAGMNFYTEKEAAAILRLSPRTLRQWRWLGKGPRAVKVSTRCVRYRHDDLDKWSCANASRTLAKYETLTREEMADLTSDQLWNLACDLRDGAIFLLRLAVLADQVRDGKK